MADAEQHELMPAITLMERKVDEAEQKANQLLGALNVLRSEAGLPPRSPNNGGGGSGDKVPTQIKPDSFFGKKQQTAIREYLVMRRAQGLGPAKPREIHDALVAGGYQFEAKSPEVALVGLRALLRKRSETFVQLGNGAYGLVVWYPDYKKPKAALMPHEEDNLSHDGAADEEGDESEAASDSEADAA